MEKPLLVSAPLIKPIQDDLKTATRRLTGLKNINQNPTRFSFQKVEYLDRSGEFWGVFLDCDTGEDVTIKSPYGGPGTILWVRENFYAGKGYDDMPPRSIPADIAKVGYMADGDKPDWAGKTRPAIHLPRWLSRIELINVETSLEPLAAITEEGAVAEGIQKHEGGYKTNYRQSDATSYLDGYSWSARDEFKKLWESINNPGSWDHNPWVWVVKFKRKTPDNETATPSHTSGN